MYTFLFWNLNRKPLTESIVRIAVRYEVDLIILAENTTSSAKIVSTINTYSSASYEQAPILGCRKLELFTRFPGHLLKVVLEDERLTARSLILPGTVHSILLIGLHFPSKSFMDEEDQTALVPIYADLVNQAEKAVGHQRSLLSGDFNMNPYERGLVSATGFNSVMSRAISDRGSRTVHGREWSFFYNPMWGLFGDRTPGPPGTYYYAGTGPASYYWHIFDQILIRPTLYQLCSSVDVKILDSDGHAPFLLSNGTPNTKVYSDHLPLLVRIEM